LIRPHAEGSYISNTMALGLRLGALDSGGSLGLTCGLRGGEPFPRGLSERFLSRGLSSRDREKRGARSDRGEDRKVDRGEAEGGGGGGGGAPGGLGLGAPGVRLGRKLASLAASPMSALAENPDENPEGCGSSRVGVPTRRPGWAGPEEAGAPSRRGLCERPKGCQRFAGFGVPPSWLPSCTTSWLPRGHGALCGRGGSAGGLVAASSRSVVSRGGRATSVRRSSLNVKTLAPPAAASLPASSSFSGGVPFPSK